jgi:hypothetical protein
MLKIDAVCLQCDYWLKRDKECRYGWQYPSCEDNDDPAPEVDEDRGKDR